MKEKVKRRGGGILIYLKNNINHRIRNDLSVSDGDKEILTIEILNNDNKNIILSCCYRPPNGDSDNLGMFLEHEVIEKSVLEKKKCYIIGDFNLNCLAYFENNKVKKFYNSMFEKRAIPIINRPTRVTNHSATLIDNIITTDIFDGTLKKGIIKTDVSDHFAIFFSCRLTNKKTSFDKIKIKKRVFSEKNIKSFKEQLELLHWEHIDLSSNGNTIYNTFVNTIHDVYDVNFPIIEFTLTKKGLNSPWITKGLKKSSKTKQKLYIKFLKTKNLENEMNYKNYKNLYEKLRKKSKKNYYSDQLKKYQNNSKQLWKIMKEITGKQKEKSNSLPQTIIINGKSLYEEKQIATEFNNFFTSVGTNLAKKIPNIQTTFDEFLIPTEKILDFHELTFDEFEKAFKSLQRNKATGCDDLNGNILIDSYDSFKNILYSVFKETLNQGLCPDLLKIAKVIPVFKAGDATNISNYRPISVLPIFSKVLERIMYNRVYNHLTSNGLLYENQFGFQRNTSTEHAILQFTRDISASFERGEYTLGVFIDLSKAFDTVDHQILLKKLECYGIKGLTLDWFKSYLQNRKQYVFMQDYSKDSLPISCGVPQGSILGPLLFLIYVNDIFTKPLIF